MRVYLIRHTEVAVGRGVCYGQSDVSLADNYAAQRDRLLTLLPNRPPSVVFASPLSRCRQLAESFTGAATDAVVRFDDRLLELNFGRWEMQPWNQIPAVELDTWMADFVTTGPPDGESFQQLADRVGAFWRETILPMLPSPTDEPQPESVYVVTHGGVIRALLCLFLDLPLQNAYRLHLDYGSLCQVKLTTGLTGQPVYLIESINR